jgi:hypothetical protein
MWPRWLVALLMLLKEQWSARRDVHIRFRVKAKASTGNMDK